MASDALFELRFILEAPIPTCQDVKNALNTFSTLMAELGPIPREEVIEQDAYDIICKAWLIFCDSGEYNIRILSREAGMIREATLRALWTLTPGFPDIIDEKAFIMIVQAFDAKILEASQIEALKLMRNICIKSEKNREALAYDWKIVEPFVNVIRKDAPSSDLVREWCGALRTFVLSDDSRVSYNRAPERKRMVFQMNGHINLARFLNVYTEVATLNAIVNALGIMASNEDFCIGIEASGGFRGLSHILQTFPTNLPLMKNVLSTIRYLNISATVRQKCGGYGLMKPVLAVTWRNRGDASFSEISMSCLAFMTIRSPCAVAQLLIEKGVFFVIEIIKKHMTNSYVLKGACLTLRNVAASGEQIGRATILDGGGEAILREIAETHESLMENHVNPTLRDLGLELLTTVPTEPRTIPEVEKLQAAVKGSRL